MVLPKILIREITIDLSQGTHVPVGAKYYLQGQTQLSHTICSPRRFTKPSYIVCMLLTEAFSLVVNTPVDSTT